MLKFLGDGMLAIFPFVEGARDETCIQALDAAAEAMNGLDGLNAARREAGKPIAAVTSRSISGRYSMAMSALSTVSTLRDRAGGKRSRAH